MSLASEYAERCETDVLLRVFKSASPAAREEAKRIFGTLELAGSKSLVDHAYAQLVFRQLGFLCEEYLRANHKLLGITRHEPRIRVGSQ